MWWRPHIVCRSTGDGGDRRAGTGQLGTNLEVDVRRGCEREFNRRFSFLSSRAAMTGRSAFDDSLFVLQELPEGRMRFEWDTYMRVEAMRTYNIFCEGIIDMDGNILSISMDATEQII